MREITNYTKEQKRNNKILWLNQEIYKKEQAIKILNQEKLYNQKFYNDLKWFLPNHKNCNCIKCIDKLKSCKEKSDRFSVFLAEYKLELNNLLNF